MSEAFLGEIRIFGFNFAPRGWAFCNGQIMAISQNTALFSLLGTTYGGNGQTTFALPDLRGRMPVHAGDQVALGEVAGSESVTVDITQLPSHQHIVQGGVGARTTANANNAVLVPGDMYATVNANGSPTDALSPAAVLSSGGTQPHTNMQPYLGLNFSIALTGIFPSRN